MKNSNIEWCDHTFNPWEGCTKVSPGCTNCYAENRNARFGGGTAMNWGKGAPRRRTSVQNWAQPVKWNRTEEMKMVSHAEFAAGIRPRVFCASLADWLDDEVPIEWLADLLNLIQSTPSLDWLLLTKRPENWRSRMKEVRTFALRFETPDLHWFVHAWLDRADIAPPANVWIGTTVEDQARADERIPKLLKIPARVRFLSCEPLLGPVDLTRIAWASDPVVPGAPRTCLTATAAMLGSVGRPAIDWVICGGESGPKARPMHPYWARSLRDQCYDADVPFLFKQWGEWLPDVQRQFRTEGHITWGLVHENGTYRPVLEKGSRLAKSDPTWFTGETGTTKVGKHAAERLLDGIEHNGFPGGGT
jgi:protein gp37